MIKYINLKAVLTQVPKYLKEEESEGQLLSWALSGYRENITLSTWKDDYKVCISKITDNKAKLPFGINKIASVGYSTTQPVEENDTTTTWIDSVINNDFVTLSQAIAYANITKRLTTLRYVGQNPELLTHGCVNLFSDCVIHFAVDKQLKYITLDEKDGYLVIVYTSSVTSDGDYMIPNDATLLRALSMFIQARHWESRAGRKEEGAENLFISRLTMADNLFRQYKNRVVLDRFNPDVYKFQILDRFNSLHNGAVIMNS